MANKLPPLFNNKIALVGLAAAAAAGAMALFRRRSEAPLPPGTEQPADAGQGAQTSAGWPAGSERVDIQSYIDPISTAVGGLQELSASQAETIGTLQEQIRANTADDAADDATLRAARAQIGRVSAPAAGYYRDRIAERNREVKRGVSPARRSALEAANKKDQAALAAIARGRSTAAATTSAGAQAAVLQSAPSATKATAAPAVTAAKVAAAPAVAIRTATPAAIDAKKPAIVLRKAAPTKIIKLKTAQPVARRAALQRRVATGRR